MQSIYHLLRRNKPAKVDPAHPGAKCGHCGTPHTPENPTALTKACGKFEGWMCQKCFLYVMKTRKLPDINLKILPIRSKP